MLNNVQLLLSVTPTPQKRLPVEKSTFRAERYQITSKPWSGAGLKLYDGFETV